ncbi:two-component system response regulator [Marivirga lumbricoides]|uniref:Two-component system response regulator n=1 Tax=Marivirga lumbricoides TaxID=1046115 RepID=A0A2T4DU48_9BACT|nr:two-component system response regulator [Marivirga lumbricoides]
MKKNILVVEDFQSIRDYLCKFLESKGYTTFQAIDGEQALEMLANGDINLVLSDYNMPKVNGMDLLKRIKENPDHQNIPVIFLTSEEDLNLMKKAREAGLFAWIKKPYDSRNFLATLDRALDSGRVSA